MKSFFILFTLIAFALAAPSTINVKDTFERIKKCYLTNKDQFNACLLDLWKELRPLLAEGIPELDVPKLDPMSIERIDFSQHGALVTGEASFTDVTVNGLGSHVPKSIVADIEARTITCVMHGPHMDVAGLYNIDMQILLFPVKGNGTFSAKLGGIDGHVVAHVEREGTGLRLVSIDIDFEVKTVEVRFNNLLGGEEVGEAINKLINDKAQELIKDIKPELKTRLDVATTRILSKAFKELPGETFFRS